MFKLNII